LPSGLRTKEEWDSRMANSNEYEYSIRECEKCGKEFEAQRRKYLKTATWSSYCRKCMRGRFVGGQSSKGS